MKYFPILIIIFICNYSYAQRSKRINIIYSESYFKDGVDSIRIKRTQKSEWHKLSEIDNSLFVYASLTESSLDKSNISDAEMYLSNLKNTLSNDNVKLDLTSFEKEIFFRKQTHLKSTIEEQLPTKVKTYEKNVVIGNDSLKCFRIIQSADLDMNNRVYSSQIERVLDFYADCLKHNDHNCQDYDKYDLREPLKRSILQNEYTVELNFYNNIQAERDKKQKNINDSITEIRQQEEIKIEKEQQLEEEKQQKKDELLSAEKEKQRSKTLIQKYGKEYGELIIKHKVVIGMTKEMCLDAWGKPEDINRTTNAYGTHEQWVYNLKSYLYFDNGILTTFQN